LGVEALTAPNSRGADCFDNAFQILQDVAVGETQHVVTLRSKLGVTPLIASLARRKVMAFTVDLHDKPRRVADKVSNVILHRDLSTKAQVIDMMCFEIAP